VTRGCLILLIMLTLPQAAAAEQLTVAAAADLSFALPEIAAAFQKQTGNTVKVVFGSSGNFFSQIANGAPFDVFLSADRAYPERLEVQGLAEPGSLCPYAIGRLVLWVPRGSPIDVATGLQALRDPRIAKIAIANPEHAPYGRAALEALQRSGLYESVSAKLVKGENIAQTAQFVESGAAQAGILALSLVASPAMAGHGRYVEIPDSLYSPIVQAGIVLKSSAHKQLAREFLAFLKKPAATAILKRYGFALPPEATPSPR
jgi:molybdate transport system substrate-binding protein